ncbi:MAG: multicopper oxidase domain-containing protein [Gammaproteobacteria bacterium]|nr:multicopper oxidase domain-containing protein [Gammaproteobacteria bacterium]MDE2069924.1 multicopper oxidase domain-containing protein [Gammaproteobacteria bacterium]
MRKTWFWVAAIVFTALTGSAVAASISKPMNRSEHFAYGHPGAGIGPAHVIHVHALDTLRFEPARIVVSRGETVEFIVSNAGKLAHEFVIGDAALQAAHQQEMQAMPGMGMRHDVNAVSLPPGQTRDLVWTFTRDGTVEYACHVAGHFAAGMVGKIIIESAKHG